MTDKELIRRALMGDEQAQQECTEKRIVLPCPSCGGESRLEDMGWPHHVYCTECGMRSVSAKWGEDGEKEVIKKWNTRPAPPVGRCKDCLWYLPISKRCKYSLGGLWGEVNELSFCSCFNPKED